MTGAVQLFANEYVWKNGSGVPVSVDGANYAHDWRRIEVRARHR
jgi:hypothetical protein